jgi:hypothetical protein
MTIQNDAQSSGKLLGEGTRRANHIDLQQSPHERNRGLFSRAPRPKSVSHGLLVGGNDVGKCSANIFHIDAVVQPSDYYRGAFLGGKKIMRFSLLSLLVFWCATTGLVADSVVDSTGIGDGFTDDTTTIQAEINNLKTSAVLDGQNRLYVVGTLLLKSNMTLRNFRFLAQASATPYTSPVTIDGNSSVKTNITIKNVHINGNRSFQTNLTTPYEDGGRSCFRIVRAATNIWIIDSSASYCATDGLIIYSQELVHANDSTHNFQNIHVINSRFENNRRDGCSGDSMANVSFYNTVFKNNGNDINGGLREGDRGARLYGYTYGAGIDIEGVRSGRVRAL